MDSPSDFAAAYDRHAPDVLRAAFAVLRDKALAEEVVQDVFLALWRGTTFDPSRGTLGPYLRMLGRSRALDLWRRQRSSERTASRLEGQAPLEAADEPQLAALRAAERRVARDAVQRLPADQRRAIMLTYWGGLTTQEAAEVLGIPLGTAKSRVRLALRKLAADPALTAAA